MKVNTPRFGVVVVVFIATLWTNAAAPGMKWAPTPYVPRRLVAITNTYTGTVALPETIGFTAVGSLVASRYGHTATLLSNGKVLVVGGRDANGILRSAELYDPAQGTWSETGQMQHRRLCHTATVLPDGRVLVAGGNDGAVYFGSAEIYDPAVGDWTTVSSMQNRRSCATAVLLTEGKVLVAGGTDGEMGLSTAELFDPLSATWIETGRMQVGRSGHTAVRLPRGVILVIGGMQARGGNNNWYTTAELYDNMAGSWYGMTSLKQTHSQHASTLLPYEGVLVLGGNSASAERSDYIPHFWEPAGIMKHSRTSSTATLLANEMVLVTGGGSALTELYDWRENTWRQNGSMSSDRASHTATLLPGDQVLVVGGRSASGAALGTAEIGTLMPPNIFTGSLGLPTGWTTKVADVVSVNSSSAAALQAASLSNDGVTWGDWLSITNSIPLTVSWNFGEDGANKPVLLRLRDVKGQVATVVTGFVDVDTTAPVGSVTIEEVGPRALRLTLRAVDPNDVSGVSSMRVGLAGGYGQAKWESYVTSKTISLDGLPSGFIDVLAQFRDAAGNISGIVRAERHWTYLPAMTR